MTLTSGEVRVAGTGELFLAPVGTALPAAAGTALNAAFKGYGLTTEDGVVLSKSIEREGVPAWQSTTPVRYIISGQELTIACTFLQSNEDVLKLWLGAAFVTDGSTGFKAEVGTVPAPLQFAMILQWADGAVTSRLTIPKVEISETGDVSLSRGVTSFPITFAALTPDSGSVLATWLTSDANFATS